ncbi:hypothetical protein D3C79_838490 [compost metagenome]
MTGMVDAPAFNHHDKAVFIRGQNIQRFGGHCRQTRDFRSPIRNIGNVRVAEQAQNLGIFGGERI